MMLVLGALVLLGAGAVLWGPVVSSSVEKPSYGIEFAEGPVEFRRYGPMVVAEVDVSGERETAINDGFRLVADYIFGSNTPRSPASSDAGERISMTAPVIQKGAAAGTWTVSFVMPSRYTLATLPVPANPAVRLKEIPGKRYAAIRFSGLASKEALGARTEELAAALRRKGVVPTGNPTYAFYDPPWTLPFLRRNEILMELPDGSP